MLSQLFQNSRFLIVDDEQQNLNVLTQMLHHWEATHIATTTDPREVESLLLSYRPDVILLDLMMPGLDGFGVMEKIRPLVAPQEFLPILVLTADTSEKTKRRALMLGASDFLTKPFDAIELSLRLQNLLARRLFQCQMQNQNESLDQQVRARTEQLAQAEIDTADCLAMAGEYRDDDTGQHTKRVGTMAAEIALILGMDALEITSLRRAAALHDVGKIGIPDRILLKPGKLTDEEFATIKTHTNIGAAIMENHHTVLLRQATEIALTHHERWDGHGYPRGISGEDIPLTGRIVAVADVFDALTHERPYKKPWPVEQAVAEIVRGSGTQFCPDVVTAFSELITEK